MSRHVLCCLFLAFLALTLGCGNPHGTVKVTGSVTVAGEHPPGPGTVTFSVVEPAEGFPNRPAMARFDVDGQYEVTSFQPGDGLVPGRYSVAIHCYETPPNMEGKPVKSFIHDKYMSPTTSGFELSVEPKSKPMVFDIDLEE